jgi:hypothetical protein
MEWDYAQERPYKGDVLKETRPANLHVFYNPEKAASDQLTMNYHFTALHNNLEEGKKKDYHI